jgi:hypothetical protein
MSETFYNIVGGTGAVPADNAWFESRNPADTRDRLGRFVESGPHRYQDSLHQVRAELRSGSKRRAMRADRLTV